MRTIKNLLAVLLVGASLTSCVNNCDWIGTETYEYDDGFNVYIEVYDVYECDTILRDRRLINNDENVIVE